MMQGDQYRLPFYLKYNDKSNVSPTDLEEIELSLGGIIRKTMSEGAISYDPTEQVYFTLITQKESFLLRGTIPVQLRVKLKHSEDVVGIDMGKIDVMLSLSKVVL